jgi:hypothetical protein
MGPLGMRRRAQRRGRRRGLIVGAAIGSAAARSRNNGDDPDQYDSAEPQDDAIAELEKLADLRDRGVLTEEEFTAEKKQLLDL